MTKEERDRLWEEWVATRPPNVQEVARKFPPWNTYLLKKTGQHLQLVSYDEPNDPAAEVTLTVNVWRPEFPPGEVASELFQRTVFGVHASDLELAFPE